MLECEFIKQGNNNSVYTKIKCIQKFTSLINIKYKFKLILKSLPKFKSIMQKKSSTDSEHLNLYVKHEIFDFETEAIR